ncbi:hypothetical protein I3843_09G164900 [Carya illinoinensis]|nr:hypothetical protein I3843_09G164900 [Carya illinoinensis]
MKLSVNLVFQAPIILGRLFLATSNALINCRSGVLKLGFGNMTLELNTFNMCKQPQEVEEPQEVNLLEGIFAEYFPLITENFEEVFEILEFADQSLLVFHVGQATTWMPKVEQLGPAQLTEKVDKEQIQALDLKPLPTKLKENTSTVDYSRSKQVQSRGKVLFL